MNAVMAIFSFLYIFWPMTLLFGLAGIFAKDLSLLERLRRFVNHTSLGWLVWAIALGFIYIKGSQPVLIMPKKLDHALFFAFGAIFCSASLGWMIIRWRNRWIHLKNARKIEDLLNLKPDDFEALIAGIFRAYGHQANITGGNSDHGVDIVIQTTEGEKWIVQCKRYSGSVGEPILRDLYGTMSHEEAQKAYLITTGGFTAQALEWAEGKPLILYDGDALVKLINRTGKRTPKVRRL